MNKLVKLLIITAISIIVLFVFIILICRPNIDKKEKITKNVIEKNYSEEISTQQAIVIKKEAERFYVVDKNELNRLLIFKYNSDNNDNYKLGQEILIYYNDGIIQTAPEKISGVIKVDIINEESNIEIPEDILKYVNYSKDNILIEVAEFTNTTLAINIVDNNEFPLNYPDQYNIYKYNNSHDLNYVEEEKNELNKNLKISQEQTVVNIKKSNINILKKIDWSNLYGKLEEGEYIFKMDIDLSFSILIKFKVDSDGSVLYDKPILE